MSPPFARARPPQVESCCDTLPVWLQDATWPDSENHFSALLTDWRAYIGGPRSSPGCAILDVSEGLRQKGSLGREQCPAHRPIVGYNLFFVFVRPLQIMELICDARWRHFGVISGRARHIKQIRLHWSLNVWKPEALFGCCICHRYLRVLQTRVFDDWNQGPLSSWVLAAGHRYSDWLCYYHGWCLDEVGAQTEGGCRVGRKKRLHSPWCSEKETRKKR